MPGATDAEGGHSAPAQALQGYFDRIDALGESADERGEAILGALYEYAEQIAPERP